MRFLLFLAVAAAAAIPVAAEKNELLKILAPDKDLAGWRPRPESLCYAGEKRLSDIYAGSAPYYRAQGVVEVLQLAYERRHNLLVVTINSFDSPEKARAMYSSWRKQAERRKVLQPLPLRESAGMTRELSGAVGYLLTGNYLVKGQVTTREEDAPDQLAKVLTALSRLAGEKSPADSERNR